MATDKPAEDISIDMPMQPTGSGPADFETAKMQADIADASTEAGIADETAGYDRAIREDDDTPTKTQA